MLKHAAHQLIQALPLLWRFRSTPAGHGLRHWFAKHFQDRQWYTFTQFERLPTQLEALTGPVMDHVLRHVEGPVRIVVAACSNGAEAVTISSRLLESHPSLDVEIDAFDIDEEMIRIARKGRYETAAVRSNPLVRDEFIERTFERDGEMLVVRHEVAKRVRWHTLDASDPSLRERIAPADIVFVQNVMCNLRRPLSRRIFDNVVQLMKPHSVLFVDGIDVDMRENRTRRSRLDPLDYKIERIHDEAWIVRGDRYPWQGAGLEPLSKYHTDWKRRYATIFIKR
jgi:chemotaxis methyl-accepting protein methylase